ncbi:MAG: flagellar biosynthesis protein FlhB, partial [Chloroflexota bacterium]
EARKKGQVLKSVELNTAVSLLAGAWLLQWSVPQMGASLMEVTRQTFRTAAEVDFTSGGLQLRAMSLSWLFARLTGPLLLGLAAVGVASHLGQFGLLFNGQGLTPQFSRINPLEGAKRLVSGRALAELVKTALKLAVIGYFAWRAFEERSDSLAYLAAMPPAAAGWEVAQAMMGVVWQVVGAFVIIALGDYLYQRWSFEKGLRMSREEVKQELKESEGNPQIKLRLRQRARALARQRMMQQVPKATVVVTNPTHFAVALQYEAGMEAPVVIAKGENFIAQQIKKVAREHGVPLVENKPLAQSLFKACDLGQSVPAELYRAVAEVLAFVFRLRHGPVGSGR